MSVEEKLVCQKLKVQFQIYSWKIEGENFEDLSNESEKSQI